MPPPRGSWHGAGAQGTWLPLPTCARTAGKPTCTPREAPQARLRPEGTAHLPPVGAALAARERPLPAHVEKHVVLPRRPSLHEVGGEHPGPEDDAVILEAPCRGGPESARKDGSTRPLSGDLAPHPHLTANLHLCATRDPSPPHRRASAEAPGAPLTPLGGPTLHSAAAGRPSSQPHSWADSGG